MTRRQITIFAALLASLLGAWWAAGLDDEYSPQTKTKKPAQAQRTSNPRTPTRKPVDNAAAQLALLSQIAAADKPRQALNKLGRDPFAAFSFQPPPPPPPPPQPASKPTAPPLRFKYQGLLREEGRLAVFLVDGADLLVAREGETLGGNYRVQSISENSLVLEYLPLHEMQSLNFGRLQ